MLWLYRILAVTCVAAAADASVASIHSPPLALGCLIAAFVLSALGAAALWSRPVVAAALGWMWLTMAFAAGVVFAGGVDAAGAPAFTGLSSGDSSSLLIAVAALLAAIGGMLVSRNVFARIAIALLLLYVAIPIVGSIGHGGLAAAFTTAPFAQLRGPYVAAEALFPLAALTALALSFAHLIGRRGTRSAVAIVTAVALLGSTQLSAYTAGTEQLPTIVAFEHPQAEGAAAASSQSGAAPSSTGAATAVAAPATSSASSTGGGALNAAVSSSTPPNIVFPDDVADNVKTTAASLGPALAGVFGFVATHIADDIYPGAIRGASGTLAAGAGNSADKALLLRDLIRASDPNAALRFATCSLSDADATTLVGAALAQPVVRTPIALERAAQLSASQNDASTKAVLDQWAQAWKGLTGIAKTETTSLTSALGSLGQSTAANTGGTSVAQWEIASARNHFWLQRRDGLNWVDLDPTLGTGGFGHARCAASQTMAALPDDLFAKIVVRLRVEELSNGHFASHDDLATSLRVADLSGRNLSFLFAESDSAQAQTGNPQSDATPASDATNPESYTPLLIAGTQRMTGTTFLLPSILEGQALSKALQSGAAGAVAAFGGPTPATTPTPVATPTIPEVTAVWLRIEPSTSLGSSAPIVETLFDRVGFVARSGGSAIASPPPTTDESDRYLLSHIWNIAIWTGVLAAGVGNPNGGENPSGSGRMAVSLDALARIQSRFMALRAALFEATASPPARYVLDGPSVTLFGLGQSQSGAQAEIDAATDIATDRTRPLSAGAVMPPASAAAWAVSSVLAERLIAHGGRELSPGAEPPKLLDGRDAVATFAAVRLSSIPLQTFTSSDSAGVASIEESAEGRARIDEQLAAGRTVIAPTKLPPNAPDAFWIFDPGDGSVRDELSDGRHTEMSEEVPPTQQAVRSARWWQKVGDKVCKSAAAAAFVFSLAMAGHGGSLPGAIGKIGEGRGKQKDTEIACEIAGAAGGGGQGPPKP